MSYRTFAQEGVACAEFCKPHPPLYAKTICKHRMSKSHSEHEDEVSEKVDRFVTFLKQKKYKLMLASKSQIVLINAHWRFCVSVGCTALMMWREEPSC